MKNKKEVSKEVEQVVPKYSFAEGQENITPAKRVINKTMEVTETFTFWDVLKYVAKMDKAIEDKKSELEGLITMKEAYIKEMNLMDEKLGVTIMDADYQKQAAEEIQKELAEEQARKDEKNNQRN